MENKLKADIVKTADAVRKKFRLLKKGMVEEEAAVKKRYEPLLKPLKTIIDLTKDSNEEEEETNVQLPIKKREIKKIKTDKPKNATKFEKKARTAYEEDIYESPSDDPSWNEFRTYVNQFGPLTQEYMYKTMTEANEKFDHTFGVRPNFDTDTWWIGNKEIVFDKQDNIHIENKMFGGTKGLFELLFKRIPNKNLITKLDLSKYKNILELTNAHKQGHHQDAKIASSHGVKYKSIISPLFSTGKGLLPVTDNKIDYIRWNDPNELVDRLALLIASEQAGNKGHAAEIASIEEELREGNFIK